MEPNAYTGKDTVFIEPDLKHDDTVLSSMDHYASEHYAKRLKELVLSNRGGKWVEWLTPANRPEIYTLYRRVHKRRPEETLRRERRQLRRKSAGASPTSLATDATTTVQGGPVRSLWTADTNPNDPADGAYRAMEALNSLLCIKSGHPDSHRFTEPMFTKLKGTKRDDLISFLRDTLNDDSPPEILDQLSVTNADMISAANTILADKRSLREAVNGPDKATDGGSRSRTCLHVQLHLINGVESEKPYSYREYKRIDSGKKIKICRFLRSLSAGAVPAKYKKAMAQYGVTESQLVTVGREFIKQDRNIAAELGAPHAQRMFNFGLHQGASHKPFTHETLSKLDPNRRASVLDALRKIVIEPDESAIAIHAKGMALTSEELTSAAKNFLDQNERIRAEVVASAHNVGSDGRTDSDASASPEQRGLGVAEVKPVEGDRPWHETWPDFYKAITHAAKNDLRKVKLVELPTINIVLDFLTEVQKAIDTDGESMEKPVRDLNMSLVDLKTAMSALFATDATVAPALHEYRPYIDLQARVKDRRKLERTKSRTNVHTAPKSANPESAPLELPSTELVLPAQFTFATGDVKKWLAQHKVNLGTIGQAVRQYRPNHKGGSIKRVGEDVYHYRCQAPNDDFRILFRPDFQANTSTILAVYAHKKGTGKEKIKGETVPEYQKSKI